MLFRARTSFVVSSRLPGDPEELRAHLDAVVDEVRGEAVVGEVLVDGDLERSAVAVELVFHAGARDADPEHAARRLLAEAISRAGGRPDGLLPLGEEAKVQPSGNPWSGLRTPQWSMRSFAMEQAP